MIEIKICGINHRTGLDAALAARAELIGLVFFSPSPRALTPEAAARLASVARGRARVVALVVDADDVLLGEIAEKVAPDFLQLHGNEPPARVAEVRVRFGRPVIKAMPVSVRSDLAALAAYEAVAERILFDAKPPRDATRPGGHGQPFDWSLVAGIKRRRPVMLSGGLDPGNVADAIRAVRPDGVDVSSGVESALGVKDPVKIRAFADAARAAASLAASREKVS
ncbi:MAG TPA: phosphoribosylanthranilate isomerase [Xanthobacteraceae bacterium]|nr:phosphoribosylanthranilate isomerase [Xanthobacteraceae bacterium]